MKKKTSKEELFLFKLHELASAKGSPHEEIDRYEIGKILGIHDKALDNIVQVLTKNGLTKRGEEHKVHLTDFGVRFVKENLY